ncbi:hypothetical protein COCSUDRAFT_43789 [Coccomyxa subellipsoidea C-169]|uniref:Uncharacterized protein n=1 Tax=Coccomyxa subellipsoidea (strain C-169) TaxID=574566 RepID=I0YR96_COCSC|nr:hypothetical protein COCSUDRAFT_43789 [Coccomyxa subellipsoidea C-169]EIE20915.1 hypothetical protein COCSUDRAFT_43789 [Coccomyxa subellipsoidea C-169]|eukprot:XP_005645459.1 hypothetical protein COCSUDRAFT_43789 [Coccomyxa subellipsoidea C-169]
MVGHQGACNDMLSLKDDVISKMRDVLAKKEVEHVRILKNHAEDVDNVLGRMASHAHSLRQHCDLEMERIDAALDEATTIERRSLLEQCKEAIDEIVGKLGDEEQIYIDTYLATSEDHEVKLEKLHSDANDEYNDLRRRLNMELQKMELQLEEMHATYQLGEDKLVNDEHMLREKTTENVLALKQQKRKIAQLRDSLSGLKQRYTDAESKSLQENQRLTAEYRRSAAACLNLQAKISRFQQSDTARLRAVQSMKERNLDQMFQQVKDMDQYINSEVFNTLQDCQTSCVLTEFNGDHQRNALPAKASSAQMCINLKE